MKHEFITPNELKKILDISKALDLELLCNINDTMIKFRTYETWKIKIYECLDDDKRKIFDMINEHYKSYRK